MAYSEFTLEQVGRVLGVTTRQADLFEDSTPVEVPRWLIELLNRGSQLSLNSEKSRSEFIVAPILLACQEASPVELAIFSGQRLDVDPTLGLVGECDFILSTAPPVPPLRAPIATVVEAKRNDIEAGLGQCIAQMFASRMFNRAAGRMTSPVFGCVTTGENWQFLRLDQDTALIDRRRYYLDNLAGVLRAFRAIIDAQL